MVLANGTEQSLQLLSVLLCSATLVVEFSSVPLCPLTQTSYITTVQIFIHLESSLQRKNTEKIEM